MTEYEDIVIDGTWNKYFLLVLFSKFNMSESHKQIDRFQNVDRAYIFNWQIFELDENIQMISCSYIRYFFCASIVKIRFDQIININLPWSEW